MTALRELTPTERSIITAIKQGDRNEATDRPCAATVAQRTGFSIELVNHSIEQLSAMGLVSQVYVGGTSGHLLDVTRVPVGGAATLLLKLAEDGLVYHPDAQLARSLIRNNYAAKRGDFAIEATDRGRKVATIIQAGVYT